MRKIKEILDSYSRKLNKQEQFYHILREIRKHDAKLKNLKRKEDWKGHLKEEISDVHILSSLLMNLEKVGKKALNKALRHFANKVSGIYRAKPKKK